MKDVSSSQFETLLSISKQHEDSEWGKDQPQLVKQFALSEPAGKKLYHSLSDEQLLSVLKALAKEKGHPPAQKEVFWILREYIKVRFKKWPYALTLAGLPKSAGSGGMTLEKAEALKETQEILIQVIRDRAITLGRLPHLKDLPEDYQKWVNGTLKWQAMIEAANLDQAFFIENALYKIEHLEEPFASWLEAIHNQAMALGRAPLRNEVDSQVKAQLVKRCGTWRNALYQVGLEPIQRIQPFASTKAKTGHEQSKLHQHTLYDCYYRVLNLTAEEMRSLSEVKRVKQRLGRMPSKNEISKEVRTKLQSKCGSWANVLHQLQYLE